MLIRGKGKQSSLFQPSLVLWHGLASGIVLKWWTIALWNRSFNRPTFLNCSENSLRTFIWRMRRPPFPRPYSFHFLARTYGPRTMIRPKNAHGAHASRKMFDITFLYTATVRYLVQLRGECGTAREFSQHGCNGEEDQHSVFTVLVSASHRFIFSYLQRGPLPTVPLVQH